MKAYLSLTVIGIFIFDIKGKVINTKLFKNRIEAVETFSMLNSGSTPSFLDSMLLKLANYTEIITDDTNLAKILREGDFPVEFDTESDIISHFKDNFASYAVSEGFIKSSDELNDREQSILLEMAKRKVKGISARRDLYAAQMVRSLDDIDKSLNLFSGRVREWFGLHFPELDAAVESHETYLSLILELGARANWSRTNIKRVIKSNEKVEKLSIAAQSSIGADMSDEDLRILQSFCKEVVALYKIRYEISICVEKVIEEFAPNILSITGPLIAARLVSLAGGIENLAKMPASTVQVLGAEKALFRSLKTRALPPKHGIIFQHAAIHQSPKWQRGKIARVLAAKIAIAARLDAFGGDFHGDSLKADLERKILEIKKRSKKAPEKAKKRGKRRKGKKSSKK